MPFQPPKTALGRTLPADQNNLKPVKPGKAKAKPPRNLRVKDAPRAVKRMIVPGKAGGR